MINIAQAWVCQGDPRRKTTTPASLGGTVNLAQLRSEAWNSRHRASDGVLTPDAAVVLDIKGLDDKLNILAPPKYRLMNTVADLLLY
jgi:hypothetical protein